MSFMYVKIKIIAAPIGIVTLNQPTNMFAGAIEEIY